MKSTFTFKHLDHSDALATYTSEHLEQITKFLLKEGQSQVYFSKQKSEFCVEITLNTPQKYFKAMAFNHDIYAAVDAVMMKLEKQFLKTRKLHQNHKKFELSKEGRMDHVNDQLEFSMRYRKAA